MNVSAIFAITAVFTVCLAGGIAVGFLLAWHIYLVATNQTTGKEYAHAEIHVNCVDPYYTTCLLLCRFLDSVQLNFTSTSTKDAKPWKVEESIKTLSMRVGGKI